MPNYVLIYGGANERGYKCRVLLVSLNTSPCKFQLLVDILIVLESDTINN